jgi:DEAD/DEAH box helicase domain-containing protein
VGHAAVFVYDGSSGGAGLCDIAFQKAEELFIRTQEIIETCPCETGCPGCVHSPKCGSGNRPIDKASAYFILQGIRQNAAPPEKVRIRVPAAPGISGEDRTTGKQPPSFHTDDRLGFGVLDLETQRSAQEVGGWHRAAQMGISCVVVYDSRKDDYVNFMEDDIPELVDYLEQLDYIVGFNIKRFDYLVLSNYTDYDFSRLKTLDILEDVHKQLGYRLSLDHLAGATLGTRKSGNGLMALEWWKTGEIQKILDYCKMDVRITKDLFLFGKENGYLLFNNKAGHTVRVPVDWV